jgi:hypothetical protein
MRRGLFIDDYVYSISYGGVLVHAMSDLVTPVASVALPAPVTYSGGYYPLPVPTTGTGGSAGMAGAGTGGAAAGAAGAGGAAGEPAGG